MFRDANFLHKTKSFFHIKHDKKISSDNILKSKERSMNLRADQKLNFLPRRTTLLNFKTHLKKTKSDFKNIEYLKSTSVPNL